MCLAPNIEDGILSGNENNARTLELKRMRESLTIGGFYAAYAEKSGFVKWWKNCSQVLNMRKRQRKS